jgi:hypothetical protein
MQRKASKIGNRALILIFSAVILLSAAVIFAARLYRPQNAEAVLYADGREVRRFSLAGDFEPYTFTYGGNTLLIEPGAVSVCEADCPDRLCVIQGKIRTPNLPIVCLPNHLSVVIVSADSAIDGVAR